MERWNLTRTESDEWIRYELTRDGSLVATARWRALGPNAEIHNEVRAFGPQVLKRLREAFVVIRRDIRQAGCSTVVTMAPPEIYGPKLAHYWRSMGFDFFTERLGIQGAAMEV